MKPLEHEYKVMGLSAYSKSKKHINDVCKVFIEMLDFKEGNFFSKKPLQDSYFDLKNRLEGFRFDNIAAGLQEWSTLITKKWIEHWLKLTNKKVVCFSGGLSMNVKSNGEIIDKIKDLKNMYVPASGGDETLSIGACFFAAKEISKIKVNNLNNIYLGKKVSSKLSINRCKDILLKFKVDPKKFDFKENVSNEFVAELLSKNNIIARC